MIQEFDQAKRSLYELVKHVFYHSSGTIEGITYQELATRIGRINKHGMGHGHGMGWVLGEMGHLLQNLEGDWGEVIPHLQSLVINKAGQLKGLPDDGIKEFWPEYPGLTREEKRNKVRMEYARIVEFGSRWNKVLSDLRLPPIKDPSEKKQHPNRPHGGGGESPEHKALKEHVYNNPNLVQVDHSYMGFREYSFPSLDAVDVLFKSCDQWVAVEVKSRTSDQFEGDFERGLYQCVKYRALLEAMKSDSHYAVPDKFRVVLLLETKLPQQYRSTAKALGVEVIEGIAVPQVNHE
jgi:hypothetical protein